MLYLDDDVVRNLNQEENMSLLVNRLLRKYYKTDISRINEELEQTQNRLSILEQKKKEAEERKLRIAKVLDGLPQMVRADFHDFPNMSEDILKSRFNMIYKDKFCDLDFNKILNAFREYRKI